METSIVDVSVRHLLYTYGTATVSPSSASCQNLWRRFPWRWSPWLQLCDEHVVYLLLSSIGIQNSAPALRCGLGVVQMRPTHLYISMLLSWWWLTERFRPVNQVARSLVQSEHVSALQGTASRWNTSRALTWTCESLSHSLVRSCDLLILTPEQNITNILR